MEDSTEMLLRNSFDDEGMQGGGVDEPVEIRETAAEFESVDNLPLETNPQNHEKVRDFTQNDRGIRVHLDRSRDAL
ncbi:MAG: hypothetical protein OEZ03_09015, partial [Alphaproteobacteria bacterium]|nr:hypothetical protein [Alphaproteobacteria bacterium]